MITRLHIENYILIDSLDITIEKGLNTVTGETGAGKSILLGAISLLLGGRGDSSLIKTGANNLIVEAQFNTLSVEKEIRPLFAAEDIEYSQELTIRRILTNSGKSKNYVNDEPVTLTFLKEIGTYLVDIHSQHQTLLLSNHSFQTSIVDSVAATKEFLGRYRALFATLTEKRGEITKLKESNEQAQRERDYIEYQFNQLNEANLKAEEKEELEGERDLLSNAQTIGEAIYKSTTLLDGGEENIISSLQTINSSISKIEHYLPTGDEFSERLSSILIEAKDLNRELELLGSKIEENPKRLIEVEARLDTLFSLEQKHQVGSTEELIAKRDDFSSQLLQIDSIDDQVEKLQKELQELEKKAWEEAVKIREKRLKIADKLGENIVKNLVLLGMPNAHLKVIVSPLERLESDGADDVTFLFSANGSSSLEKIDKVASGGEMSRLMLSLKVIASAETSLPTILFDEIDSGVSGKVADCMGTIMEKLSEKIQIINITHLPQVASKGEHHFYVYKEHLNGESRSHIIKLSPEQRIDEIAVMLSGSNVTDAAREQAKVLLQLK